MYVTEINKDIYSHNTLRFASAPSYQFYLGTGVTAEGVYSIIMLSLSQRGGDMLVYACPLRLSVCAAISIVQAVKHETLTQFRDNVCPASTTLTQP